MSLNKEQSNMAAVRSFKDAVLFSQQRKMIWRIKAIVMVAVFEKAHLGRIKWQELTVLRFQDCDQLEELFPVFQKIEIGFHC